MSSNDRHNRTSRPHPASGQDDNPYTNDVLFDDDWAPQGASSASPASPRRRSNPDQQPAARQSSQGTAAQIDRLQRNLNQGGKSGSAAQSQSGYRRPAQQVQRTPIPADDVIVTHDDIGDPHPPLQSRSRPRGAPVRTPSVPKRSSRQETTLPATSNREPYVDETLEDFDDGYLEYEDDFSEYDAPRPPERAARPATQLRMPTITRPTLPPAIARADVVNDAPALAVLGIGLVSLAAMAILVANRADSLAPQFATHVSASGVLEDFRDSSAIWNIPLMSAMVTLMSVVMAWFISPIDRFASRFVLVGSLVVQFVAWVALIRIL